ncbi:hypothetical protein RQP53_03515 [Paucibacter sp. APW11]|uniref:Primosomal replication protein PriB/PriC domain protein n=1 Tax=Roseateles aquae TaxID=3077235 RepID=A0ABU3P6Z5_9BURK|nr:hypothetical protein [Paucibacter sp. APW11]MDT8998341.1 hypothetical protein [Paucibacter sp. APW11]
MTTPTAQEMLDAYLKAELDVLAGKQVRMNLGTGDRMLTREDLPAIRAGRQEWQAVLNSQANRAAGGARLGGLGFGVARLDGN